MSGSELVDNQISLVKYVPFNCLAIVFQPSLLNMSISLHIFVIQDIMFHLELPGLQLDLLDGHHVLC